MKHLIATVTMFRLTLTLTLTCLAPRAAHAGIFDEITVDGHCNHRNTQVLENGSTVSIIFDDLGADMPQGAQGDGKLVLKSCTFRVRFTFPKDQYLSGVRQVFSGGVIKSKGSAGRIQLGYNLLTRTGGPLLTWGPGEEISPDSPKAVFSKTMDETFPAPKICSGQARYQMRVGFQAIRTNLKEFFVGGLDSYDAEFAHKLRVTPLWKACSKR